MKKALSTALLLLLLIIVPVVIQVRHTAQPKRITMEQAQLRVLAPTIFASGTLAYREEVRLVPEVIGRIIEVSVKEGDRVKRGDLLLHLDPALNLASVRQLEASRNQAALNIERQRVELQTNSKKWERYRRLRDQGLVDASTFDDIAAKRDLSEVELRTAEAVLQQTEAQLTQAREALAKTEIRAPISGVVTAVLIKVGETAVPSAMSIAGGDLLVIAQTEERYAEINVDETEVSQIVLHQHAEVVPAALPDESWDGEVTWISLAPKQNGGQSKTYTVRIRLRALSSEQFRSGMSCRAEISTRRIGARSTLSVPLEAVQYEEPVNRGEATRARVYVIANGVAHVREVETGTADDSYIEILRGLRVSELVAVGPARGLRFLRDGDRVTPSGGTE